MSTPPPSEIPLLPPSQKPAHRNAKRKYPFNDLPINGKRPLPLMSGFENTFNPYMPPLHESMVSKRNASSRAGSLAKYAFVAGNVIPFQNL